MRVKFFAVPALDPDEAETAVNSFVAQHRVLSIDRELLSERSGSYWALCVTFLENASPGQTVVKKSKVDYREVLSPEDFGAFAELRGLRKELAEGDGVPLYAVFTNEQLATMVRRKLRTMEELTQLPGVGAARVEKYGSKFLDRLMANQGVAKTEEAADAPDGDSPG